MTNFIHWEAIWDRAQKEFILGEGSIHGAGHWQRVEANALALAQENGADQDVVRLFAVLHDCKRHNENWDPKHGPRAAELARLIRGELYEIENERFQLLYQAIRHHNGGKVSSNVTIGTCWDADRLDLDRVGITPSPRFMSTDAGKRLTMQWFNL